MASILTNTSSMAAIDLLRGIGQSLQTTQDRVSTGLRVRQASDNAAYWSISTTMRSEQMAQSAASDAIGLTQAILDTTYTGMEAIREEYTAIKSLLITASAMPEPAIGYWWGAIDTPQLDPLYTQSIQAKVSNEIDQHMLQIRSILASSSFNGVNLLHLGDNSPIKASQTTNTFVTGYANGKVQTLSLPLTDTLLVNDSSMDGVMTSSEGALEMGLLDPSFGLTVLGSDGLTHATGLATFTKWSIDWTGGKTEPIRKTNDMVRIIEMYVQLHGADRQAAWNYVIPQIDERIEALTTRIAKIGTIKKSVDAYDELVKKGIDTVGRGIGRLVDADMNDESSRIKALQTQQQLAIQSLSIANVNAENIVSLFRQ